MQGGAFLLVALQKTPSLLGAECQGVGTTPLHANERGQGQTVRFVAVIEPPVYWGISMRFLVLLLTRKRMCCPVSVDSVYGALL